MAYGTPEDRLRLESLARIKGQSSSEWLIEQIRAAYKELYGDVPPVPRPEPETRS
ncbi:hypothetical protein QBC99_002506 [Beijerinckia sp. GAS462]|nr:hypothetical protein [Beijerinckia sp. GAS462]SEC45337.1 hypothetical protein SAMN05443249_2725 [Beijerinckia sp. 28-YEA-48]